MDAGKRGIYVPGICAESLLAHAIELGALLDMACLCRTQCREDIAPGIAERALSVEQGDVPLPCEGAEASFQAASDYAAQLLAGGLAPLRSRQLQVVVRRLFRLRDPEPGESGFGGQRRAATTRAIERTRSLLAGQGLDRAQRKAALDQARDTLRPVAARAFLEGPDKLGPRLAGLLPDDLLLDLAMLPEVPRDVISRELKCGLERGQSPDRLRVRARRLVAKLRCAKARRQSTTFAEDPTERADAGTRRREHALLTARLDLVLALVREARELARTWNLPVQVGLLPRSLESPPATADTDPGTTASLERCRAWLRRLQWGVRRVAMEIPHRDHDLVRSLPAHPG